MTSFTLSKQAAEWDWSVINAHKPNPVHDIEIARYDNGSRGIIIKNLPFGFEDRLCDGQLTETEAQALKRQMATGNKTYAEICQVAARFNNQDN